MRKYIVKQKAISALITEADTHSNPVKKAYTRAVAIIEQIAADDVQPVKRGRWESSQRTIETGTVYCSNCAIEYYISDLQTVGDCNGIVHYCPNCGARMDGGNEDENSI